MEQALVDHFIQHFDHHDPRLGADPGQVYDTMLKTCPVTHSDMHGGFWVVSDYDNVKYILQHPQLFTTVHTVTVPPGLGTDRPLLPLELDPPEHVKYRSLLAPVFAPRRIAEMERAIRAVCTALIDGFIEMGRCEFVSEFAQPMPTRLFVSMMGLPDADTQRFHEWKNIILHGHHDDPAGVRRKQAGAEITTYCRHLIDQRKADPGEDIISVLLAGEVDGERLTDQEILDMTYLLFLAGLDTVASALSLSVGHLAQHGEARLRLVKDPSIIPSAVEELLRYESLIMAGRTVVEDVQVGGVQMHKGDRVLCNTISADRDTRQFPDADKVILDRDPNRHLAFSVGPHRCVGSHLARLELRVALEELLRRIPTFRLADGATVRRHLTSVAGIEELPLEWD
jgi:cytochrome P450